MGDVLGGESGVHPEARSGELEWASFYVMAFEWDFFAWLRRALFVRWKVIQARMIEEWGNK